MINIAIDDGSEEHELRVKPTDTVDSALYTNAKYLLTEAESHYYEPVLTIGKGISLEEGDTFAERDINRGDTVDPLPGIEEYVVIHNEFTRDYSINFGPISFSCTVGDLIDALHRSKRIHVRQFSASELALRFGTNVLDKSKTLTDYNIKNKDVLYLHKDFSTVPIGVPEYAKMEQVLFQPGMTIANLKNEVERMIPDLKSTARIREVYPAGLRGALKNTRGLTFFLYLNLFCEKMYILIHENEEDNCRGCRGVFLGGEYTLEDIWRITRREFRPDERFTSTAIWKEFPKVHPFDRTWMKMFAPQIQAEPYASNTSLPLFFFPLRTRIMRILFDSATQNSDVRTFAPSFCKKQLGLKGLKRSVYHPPTNTFLRANQRLKTCRYMLLSASVVIAKLPHRSYSKRSAPITVLVRWSTRIRLPPVPIRVETTDTINALRDEIESDLHVPFYMQKLIFNGKSLQNGNCTLGEEGITNDSIVDLEPAPNFE